MLSKKKIQMKLDTLYDEVAGMDTAGWPNPSDERYINEAERNVLEFILNQGSPVTERQLSAPKDSADLDELIAELKKDKADLPERSNFGDPNHEAYDAQIKLVEWVKGKEIK